MTTVCILSTVHTRGDTRIFAREATTIAAIPGVEVRIVLADGNGASSYNEIPIDDLGKSRNRIGRITVSLTRAFRATLALRPDVLHIHDPELLPLASTIRRITGCIAIYDAHEDLPKDILDKHWVPNLAKPALSSGSRIIEQSLAKTLDHVVAATPSIARNFTAVNTTVIANYPRLDEFATLGTTTQTQRRGFAYIGSMTAIRGIREVVSAMTYVSDPSQRLQLAGRPSPTEFLSELRALEGWDRTDYLGSISRQQVADVLQSTIAGIVPFQLAHNHIESQPNKLFEYMAAGIPVVASDFPLWRELINDVGCGITVNSGDPKAIATALNSLAADPDGAAEMGARGRQAVARVFNWEHESRKLSSLYESLISGKQNTPSTDA